MYSMKINRYAIKKVLYLRPRFFNSNCILLNTNTDTNASSDQTYQRHTNETKAYHSFCNHFLRASALTLKNYIWHVFYKIKFYRDLPNWHVLKYSVNEYITYTLIAEEYFFVFA